MLSEIVALGSPSVLRNSKEGIYNKVRMMPKQEEKGNENTVICYCFICMGHGREMGLPVCFLTDLFNLQKYVQM